MEVAGLIEKLPDIDIVEFVEKVYGIELLQYQKEMIKTFAAIPEGACIVLGRDVPLLLDKDGKRIERRKECCLKMLTKN